MKEGEKTKLDPKLENYAASLFQPTSATMAHIKVKCAKVPLVVVAGGTFRNPLVILTLAMADDNRSGEPSHQLMTVTHFWEVMPCILTTETLFVDDGEPNGKRRCII